MLRAGEADAPQATDELEESEALRRVFRCRVCDTEIADPRDVFTAGEGAVEVYVNAHGFAHEVITVHQVRNTVTSGIPTAEFTWFAGTTWVHLHCARCSHHLGWGYEGENTRPALFFGLRRTEISGA